MTHKESLKRRKEIAAHVDAGGSYASAAKKWGVTISTVDDAYRENRGSHGGRNMLTLLRVVARLIVGKESCAEIGRRPSIKVSRAYVSLIAKNAIRCRLPIHKRYR